MGTGNMATKPKVRVLAEVTETVVYQMPLDVTDPDSREALMSAWLCVEPEDSDEYRVSSTYDVAVLERPSDAVETIESVLDTLDNLRESLIRALVIQKSNSQP